MVAYNIKLITDYNEITYHFLAAMHIHVLQTKGGAPAGAQPMTSMASTSMGSTMIRAAPAGDNLMVAAPSDMDGMTPIQKNVLTFFRKEANNVDDTGCVIPMRCLRNACSTLVRGDCLEQLPLVVFAQVGHQNYCPEAGFAV